MNYLFHRIFRGKKEVFLGTILLLLVMSSMILKLSDNKVIGKFSFVTDSASIRYKKILLFQNLKRLSSKILTLNS